MTLKQIQNLLQYLGYYTILVDGIAGPRTTKAIQDFQEANDLKVDGIAGVKTQEALIKAVSESKFKSDAPSNPSQGNGASDDYWDNIKYFKRQEFACPCPRCGGFPVEPKQLLVEKCDEVREHFGKPMTISSGVRCQKHNDELSGSVRNSRHVQGKAVDFAVSGVSGSKVKAYVDTLPGIRYSYIISGNWVHMDID